MANEKGSEKYCSDERPCVNCFADQGECLDTPTSEDYKAEQGISNSSYVDEFTLIRKGEFLLKVIDGPASKDIVALAETKLQELLKQF